MKSAPTRTRFAISRPLWLALTVVFTSVTLGSPPAVTVAEAKKRNSNKKKNKRGGDSDADRTDIKHEGSLAPKKDLSLDDEITKTDAVESGVEDWVPTISLSDIEQDSTEQLLDDKINEEIDISKELLKFERECEKISEVRARLAELYWEKAKRFFFKANDFNTTEEIRKKYLEGMKKLQELTVTHYTHIVEECGQYSEYTKILYNLGKTLVELDRAKDGAQYFKRIIKEFPDNAEWMAQAWFMVGEYYFNEEENAKQAFKAYKKAEEYPDSPIYGLAIYKEGWCHINNGDWDMAVDSFQKVVTIADDPKHVDAMGRKGAVSLRKQALKDFVRAWSNIGDAGVAYNTFVKLGGKNDVGWMLENLGSWYDSRDDHRSVIRVNEDLIKHFKDGTRLPVFQGKIVNAADKLGDDKETVKEVKVLTQYFLDVRDRLSKKAKSKQLTPAEKEAAEKDIGEAEDIAENTIRRMALEHHKEAKKLPEGSKAQSRSYNYAYELYKHYLDIFPEPNPKATVNYVFFMRYYYAEVLYTLEKFLEAARNYDIVIDMNPRPDKDREKEIVMRAAEDAVRAYDELVQDIDRKSPPELGGDQPKEIPDIKKDLIRACKRYIEFVGKEGDRIVEIRYKVARIYYMYNHFDLAAPAFNDIVENHPSHDVACYAANLALDIHNYAKDYAKLRKLTRAYLKNEQLKGACEKNSSEDDFAKWRKIEEQSTFLLIKQTLEDKKKYVAAGNAYMDFFRQYGREGASQYAIDAVYNASVNYDLGQRLDKANEVREFLVKTFAKPDIKDENPLVRDTMYNIAQSFERVVDFRRASTYLDKFATKYPDDKRTKDAVYNVGLYLSTLHDFDAGRAAREKFLSRYPNDSDAAQVKYAICESLETEAQIMDRKKDNRAMKTWTDAHDCYFDWIKNKKYSDDVDRLCEAQFKRGEIMNDKTHYAKGYQEQRKFLLANWPKWKKKGADTVPRCATAVSEVMFRDMEPLYEKYAGIKIEELNPTKKDRFDKSIAAKVKERDQVIEGYKEIVGIGVAEWSLASLYMIGEAYRDSVDVLLKAPIPDKIPGYKLTAEDKKTLRDELEKMAEPIRALAVDAYKVCVDTANQRGLYNRWSMKARKRLQALRPEEYQPLIERVAVVEFADRLQTVGSGVVIADGEGIKPLEQVLKDGTGAPGSAAPEAPPAAGGSTPKADEKAAPADEAPADEAPKGDDIPGPVSEAGPAAQPSPQQGS